MKKGFSYLVVTIICGGVLLSCFGCGRKQSQRQVLATINKYVMTTSDFNEYIQSSSYTRRKMQDKEKLLDIAIKEQILIQEAQRQGLDRKKTFMRTIERYWKQTLIKELMEQESKRISKEVERSKQAEALDEWMGELYLKTDININKILLDKLQEQK